MTTLEIIGLIVGITLLAGFLGYIFSNGKESSPQIGTFSEYTPEELLNIKAAEKAYKVPTLVIEPEVIDNVQAKSISTEDKKTPKPEFPIDKPKPKKKYPRKKKPAKVQE